MLIFTQRDMAVLIQKEQLWSSGEKKEKEFACCGIIYYFYKRKIESSINMDLR